MFGIGSLLEVRARGAISAEPDAKETLQSCLSLFHTKWIRQCQQPRSEVIEVAPIPWSETRRGAVVHIMDL